MKLRWSSFLLQLLAIVSYIEGWTFIAVLPSPGNPKSKLNRQAVVELEKTTCRSCTVIGGRVRFEWDNKTPIKDLEVLLGKLGIKSLRIVAGETDLRCAHDVDEVCLPSQITSNALASMESNLTDTLEVFQLFGNKVCNSEYSVHVKCQKLNGENVLELPAFRKLSASKLASRVVKGLHDRLKWAPEPKRQKANLRIHVVVWEEEQQAVGIRVELALLILPSDTQANQDLPCPGMKRVEAWAVAKSAEIQPFHVVLDPMCGKGTFLIEAATLFQPKKLLGVDISSTQLADACINLEAMNLAKSIHLIEGDSRHLEIPDNSVDRILCCPPFGRQFHRDKYESDGSLLPLYNELLAEWDRVLTTDGRMVLLIDEGNLEDLTKAIYGNTGCNVQHLRRFRLGKLQAAMVVIDAESIVKPDLYNILPWENDSDRNKSTRATWAQLRASELPSLVPVAPDN